MSNVCKQKKKEEEIVLTPFCDLFDYILNPFLMSIELHVSTILNFHELKAYVEVALTDT